MNNKIILDANAVMSFESYSALTDRIESALDAAEVLSEQDPTRMTHEEVFAKVRSRRRRNN